MDTEYVADLLERLRVGTNGFTKTWFAKFPRGEWIKHGYPSGHHQNHDEAEQVLLEVLSRQASQGGKQFMVTVIRYSPMITLKAELVCTHINPAPDKDIPLREAS